MGVTNYIFSYIFPICAHRLYFLVNTKDSSHILPYCAFTVSIKSVGQVLTLLSKCEAEPCQGKGWSLIVSIIELKVGIV